MIDYSRTPAMLSERILEREGCPIHYWVGGPKDRPLVVLMHGATMDHRMFNAQVEALVAEYRVLVWDARGHGRSQPIGNDFSLETCAADLLAILDTLGVERVVIGGQSLGGYIAQQVYVMARERVLAMVVIGATPISRPYSKLDVWMLKATLPLFRVWPYERLVQTVARSTASTEAIRRYALEAVGQIGRDDFLKIWRAVTLAVDERGRPDLRFEVPLLLIHGEYDQTGTIRRDMPPWAQQEPDVVYHVVPSAGHNANQDHPSFTNRVLLEFLREKVG